MKIKQKRNGWFEISNQPEKLRVWGFIKKLIQHKDLTSKL